VSLEAAKSLLLPTCLIEMCFCSVLPSETLKHPHKPVLDWEREISFHVSVASY